MPIANEPDRHSTVDDLVGQDDPAVIARDPVTVSRIGDFAEAVGDTNPIYTGNTSARAAGHSGIVAPPALLQAWPLPGIIAQRTGPTATGQLYRLLDERGFHGLIAVAYTQRYRRYLSPGDHITARTRIQSVSPAKQTRLGEAHFITSSIQLHDQQGSSVGDMEWTVMKYRSQAEGAVRAAGASAATRDLPGDAGTVALPELVHTVTATDIVAGALASNDYTPIHHDVVAARESGAPDIFMNILTSCGWMHRYVTDWAGPDARIRSTEFNLGSPVYPSDVIRFNGAAPGGHTTIGPGGELAVEVVASTQRGEHLRGRVVLGRPSN